MSIPGSGAVTCQIPGYRTSFTGGIIHKNIGRDLFAYYEITGKNERGKELLLGRCPGKEVRDTLLNRVVDPA